MGLGMCLVIEESSSSVLVQSLGVLLLRIIESTRLARDPDIFQRVRTPKLLH